MRIYIWAVGLAFGLAGFLLGVGCSQPDLAKQAGTDVRAEAMQTDETAKDVAVAMATGRELPLAVPTQPAPKAAPANSEQPQVTIEHSDKAQRDAYARARSRARDASRNARDAREARDAYGRSDR